MHPLPTSFSRPGRLRRLSVVFAATLIASVSWAQAPELDGRPVPLGIVLVDGNGDLVPDAVGDTVLVAGRATISSGQLHRNWMEVFIQDESGGIKLVASSGAPTIVAGDSLIVRGRIDHELGMAQITDPIFHTVDSPPRPIKPLEVTDIGEDGLERYEGRLIEVKGTVAARVPNEAGDNLIILVNGNFVNVFAYANRLQPISFEGFEVGEYVRVRGIAGQFDRQAPFNASYQIFARTAEDITRAGLPPVWYRNTAIIVVLLLLVAAGWGIALRKQVQSRVSDLQVSETRYSHLFNAAGDSVLVHADDHTAGWIIDANNMAQRVLGYTAQEFHKLTLRTLAAEDAIPDVEEHLTDVKKRGGALHTILLKTKPGATIPFEIRTHHLNLDGKSAFMSIARDVSTRVAYEQGLIEAKKRAEDMEQLKSAFFINMSHEIRTPLTAIIGAAELLHEEVDQEQQEFTDLIEHGGKRLLNTLNAVLDFAQLDAGDVVLLPSPAEVVEEIQTVLTMHKPDADTKGLSIYFDSDVGSLPTMLDRDAFQKIMGNLVDNAIKFTAEGSVRVTIETKPELIHLHVADTGVGMDEEFLPHLFTEFKQESDGFARSHEGNGLGIAIAKKLVDLMGGRLTALSRKGAGSVLTVSLPRTPIPIVGGDGIAVQMDATASPIASGIAER